MNALRSLLPGAVGLPGGETLARGRESAPSPMDIVCEAADARPVGQVRVTPDGQQSILIENLRVEAPYRGQGLGRELISEAFELGQRWGYGRAWLVADDQGSGRLLRWYQTLGFVPTGQKLRNRPVLEASLRQRGVALRPSRVQRSRPFAFTFRAQPVGSRARTPPRERA